ncbi:MAG: TetR/AcrR family transcriptional regulator [Caulobacter sp.]|nr:TetR/AcrR family transcriptional regulator [Caulobacter sp.]
MQTTLQPRKIPRQGRSRATVDAILDACDECLALRGYDHLTTNGISERAGVSIGTLYEYFPNREAIAAALAGRAFQRTLLAMRAALRRCVTEEMGRFDACEHMLMTGVDALVAERTVFRTLATESPFLLQLPAVREARAQLLDLSQQVRALGGSRLNLPMPEGDAWLISHMLSSAMLEIACLEVDDEERRRLTRELARLTYRMAVGRDAGAAPTRPSAFAMGDWNSAPHFP